jgi:L-idonate 5-dehydrogenase
VLADDRDTIDIWSLQRGTFDVALEASGSSAGLDTTLRSAIAGRRLIQVGNLPSGQSPVAAKLVMSKELLYHGSFRFNADDFAIAVEEIVTGKIDLKALMTHAFPPAKANRGFEVALDRSQSMKVHFNLP